MINLESNQKNTYNPYDLREKCSSVYPINHQIGAFNRELTSPKISHFYTLLNRNSHFSVERSEYFENLLIELKERWDYQLQKDSVDYRSKLYDLYGELNSMLHTHSIYSNGKKFCSTLFKFEIIEFENHSEISFLKGMYSNYKKLAPLFEEENSFSRSIILKDNSKLRIRIYEGFIEQHPESFSYHSKECISFSV